MEVLLIGGRSGSGKSSAGWEASAILREAEVPHCHLEGDFLDQVHPAPPDDPTRSTITTANLAAIWRNYAALGHTRLIYVNTVAILEADMFTTVMGAGVRMVNVLLTAEDSTVEQRLGERERGSELEAHIRRSAKMSRHLDEHAPPGTVRVATDGRGITEVARDAVAATGWLGA